MNWDAAMQLADKLLEKGGALGVLVICVGMFLAFLALKIWEDAKAEQKRNDTMERMGNACHTAQFETIDRVERMHDRTVDALDRNTEAFGRTAAALDKVLKVRNRKPRESKGNPNFVAVAADSEDPAQEPP